MTTDPTSLAHRVALPVAANAFFVLAVIVPALRVRRRTGVWPIVVGSSGAPHQRLGAWLMRAFAVGAVAWQARYAIAGPAAAGVVAAPPAVAVVGWTLVVGAMALLMVAQAQMGAAWRIGIDERATPLITHGLYRLVRNPIYSAMYLVLAGGVLVAPSLATLAGAIFLAAALAVQTRLEERHLAALHGASYREYAARVGRFVPGLGRLR